jgi:hypothetical protein
MVDTKAGFIPLATLAQYKSIIWDVYSDPARSKNLPLLYSYISHRPKNPDTAGAAVTGKVLPNVLALTMAAGGHIMVCGNFPVQDVVSRTYTKNVRFPIIWLYELEGKQSGVPRALPGNDGFCHPEHAACARQEPVLPHRWPATARARGDVSAR